MSIKTIEVLKQFIKTGSLETLFNSEPRFVDALAHVLFKFELSKRLIKELVWLISTNGSHSYLISGPSLWTNISQDILKFKEVLLFGEVDVKDYERFIFLLFEAAWLIIALLILLILPFPFNTKTNDFTLFSLHWSSRLDLRVYQGTLIGLKKFLWLVNWIWGHLQGRVVNLRFLNRIIVRNLIDVRNRCINLSLVESSTII